MTENVLSLKPWDAALRRAKSKTTDLLQRSDIAAVVESMSPLEAYTTVKTLGPADATPVLALLKPEQVRTLWDLEGWHQHRLSVSDVVLWMSAFREASLEAMQQAADALDLEALSALLRRRLYIGLKPRDDRSDDDPVPLWMANPSPEIEPLVETPDGRFIIAARPSDEDETADEPIDEDDRKWILSFVSELYQQENWEDVAAVLRSAVFDLTTNLEEDAYRFRSGRLEDLGFPPRETAISIYGLLDPTDSTPLADAPIIDLSLPVTYAAPLQQGLFQAAMRAIDDAGEIRRLEGDLVAVANKALVADGVAPGQFEAVGEVLDRLRGYVELALAEGVAPAERESAAARRLKEKHLERLFRIGYTLTVRAAGRARRLLERPALGEGSRDLALRRLSVGEQGVIEALLLRRPRVSGALEPVVRAVASEERGEGAWGALRLDAGAAEVRRAFLTPADLAAVRWVLDDLEALADAFAESAPARPPLAGQVNLPLEERTLDVELATASANVMLGRSYAVVPLGGADLADLSDRIGLDGDHPRFRASDVARATEAIGHSGLGSRLQRVLEQLAEELWPHVGRDRIDPRFLTTVLTDLA